MFFSRKTSINYSFIEIMKIHPFFKKRQLGFSLVELLITVATISALTGIGLAVYSQYQQRAYNSNALQQGMNLRTSFEAGLTDRSALGSTVFSNNPSTSYSIDGTLACSGCDDFSAADLYPGFIHQPGVKIIMSLFDLTQSYQIQVGHCKAPTADRSSFDAWQISDQDASIRVALPDSDGELDQCAVVLAGGDLVATPTPEPTSTPDACDPAEQSVCSSGGGIWCDEEGACGAYGTGSSCSCSCDNGTYSGSGSPMSWQGTSCGCNSGEVGDGVGGCCAPWSSCGCSGGEIRDDQGLCVDFSSCGNYSCDSPENAENCPGDCATPTPDPATPTPDPATPTPDPATPTPDPATPTPDPATPTATPATPTATPATPTATPATPTATPAYCGDGMCNNGESCGDCENDCGIC
jgi:type II secretory pathway pseudopilin PulG